MERTQGVPATGLPVLMLLDEFPGLGRMKKIENAAAQIAGHGVKLFFVTQGLAQLKSIYKENWETLFGAAGAKIFFNLDEQFSREYVSKLIGETEVMRETATAGETQQKTETETVGGGTSRTSGLNFGKSEGVNSGDSGGYSQSVGKGTSVSENKGRNWGGSISYGPKRFWQLFPSETGSSSYGGTSEGESWGETTSEGQTWNSGWSSGVSEGRTEGVSESTGENSNWSAAKGTSAGTSRGVNETLHRRPLIYPNEIGSLFGSVDDRRLSGYPGLALTLTSGGERSPFPVRRVLYYEDEQFIRWFDPHPEKGIVEAFETGDALITAELGLERREGRPITLTKDQVVWLVGIGTMVRQGEVLGYIQLPLRRVNVTAPVAGKVLELWGGERGDGSGANAFFKIGHYRRPVAVKPETAIVIAAPSVVSFVALPPALEPAPEPIIVALPPAPIKTGIWAWIKESFHAANSGSWRRR
jgi:hypothetical protein